MRLKGTFCPLKLLILPAVAPGILLGTHGIIEDCLNGLGMCTVGPHNSGLFSSEMVQGKHRGSKGCKIFVPDPLQLIKDCCKGFRM